MILKNKRAIPCELYEITNGNIVEYVEKNIANELCKSIADIISHGGEYICSMTQAELSNSSTTNSIVYERKAFCDPLVRCKDCRWYDNYCDVCHNPRYGDGHANYQPPYVDEDYWCKDGERKGGDTE